MNNVVEEFYNKLKENDNILGIILFGSWARGNSRLDSDIDLIVIKKEGFKKTVEVYKEVPFEIIYTTEQSIKDYWKNSPDSCVEVWNIAKIIFDRNGVINELKKYADDIKKEGKRLLSENELNNIKFDVYDQIRASESLIFSNPSTAYMIANSILINLCKQYFDVYRIWTPPIKQMLDVLQTVNPEIVENINKFYGTTELKIQIVILKNIADIVFKNNL